MHPRESRYAPTSGKVSLRHCGGNGAHIGGSSPRSRCSKSCSGPVQGMHPHYATYAPTWLRVCTYVWMVCTHVSSHMHPRGSGYARTSGGVCTDIYLDPTMCKTTGFRLTRGRGRRTIAATSGYYVHHIPLLSAIVAAAAHTLAAVSQDLVATVVVVVPARVCTHIMRRMYGGHGSGYARTLGWYAPMSHSICTYVGPGMHAGQGEYALTSI